MEVTAFVASSGLKSSYGPASVAASQSEAIASTTLTASPPTLRFKAVPTNVISATTPACNDVGLKDVGPLMFIKNVAEFSSVKLIWPANLKHML
jgi:hypothetical protein